MAKNIVICCDGTGNEFGESKSNVVKLYKMLACDATQVTYYHPGVGTMGASAFVFAEFGVGGVSPRAIAMSVRALLAARVSSSSVATVRPTAVHRSSIASAAEKSI